MGVEATPYHSPGPARTVASRASRGSPWNGPRWVTSFALWLPRPVVPRPQTVRLKNGTLAVIRPAVPEDAEVWIANVNATGSEMIYLMTERITRTPEEIRRQFTETDSKRDLWLVGEVDGRVVAGADFRRGQASKNAHVATLGVAVRKEVRGLGLGEAMMRYGIDWAREIGVKKLRLGVFSTNERAIALYRKLGFEEEGRLKKEVVLRGEPVDEILMALWL